MIFIIFPPQVAIAFHSLLNSHHKVVKTIYARDLRVSPPPLTLTELKKGNMHASNFIRIAETKDNVVSTK